MLYVKLCISISIEKIAICIHDIWPNHEVNVGHYKIVLCDILQIDASPLTQNLGTLKRVCFISYY